MAEEEIERGESGAVERYDSTASEISRMFRDAEAVINEWLDEADLEGAAIIRRARNEAARQTAEMKVSASEQIAAALREADAAATARRKAAEEEADRRLQQTEEEVQWRLRQAEADAVALQAKANAAAAAVQQDVGELQRQLTELVERAVALLPVLDAARQLAIETGAPEPEPEPEPVEEDDIVEAEVVVDEPQPEPVAYSRGLGQLVRDDEVIEERPLPRVDGAERRRGLGRLLGRR